MRLIIPVLLNCLCVVAIYLADRYTPMKKMPYMAKQIAIGILFGADRHLHQAMVKSGLARWSTFVMRHRFLRA